MTTHVASVAVELPIVVDEGLSQSFLPCISACTALEDPDFWMVEADPRCCNAKRIKGINKFLRLFYCLEIFFKECLFINSAGLEPLADAWLPAPKKQ